MDLAGGYSAKTQNYSSNRVQNGRAGLNSNTVLVIKLPDPRVLNVLSRSMFVFMLILLLPCIRSVLKSPSSSSYSNGGNKSSSDKEMLDLEFLDLLLQDFCSEGLIKRGDKALILTPIVDYDSVIGNSRTSIVNEIELVIESDSKRVNVDDEFDLVLVPGYTDPKSIDHVVNTGGILAIRIDGDDEEEVLGYNQIRKQSNYEFVYLRRYVFTVLAMRKRGVADEFVNHSTRCNGFRINS